MFTFLEGRDWMTTAIKDYNVKIQRNMIKGKYYIHQMYTTVFVEFNSMEELIKCKEHLDLVEPYWDYDGIALIDTNNDEQWDKWGKHFVLKSIEESQKHLIKQDF